MVISCFQCFPTQQQLTNTTTENKDNYLRYRFGSPTIPRAQYVTEVLVQLLVRHVVGCPISTVGVERGELFGDALHS